MNAKPIYTHADMTLALEGSRRNVTDEVTHDVIRQVMTWLRGAAIESRDVGDETRADTLLEIADDISDGEWRRPTSPLPSESK